MGSFSAGNKRPPQTHVWTWTLIWKSSLEPPSVATAARPFFSILILGRQLLGKSSKTHLFDFELRAAYKPVQHLTAILFSLFCFADSALIHMHDCLQYITFTIRFPS